MESLQTILHRIEHEDRPDPALLAQLLRIENREELDLIYARAYDVKRREVSALAYFRGLIEVSNVCAKDCLYCGIRRSGNVSRYTMSNDEVIACARFAYDNGYGSIVLQSGERRDPAFVELIEDMVREINDMTGDSLGITLSAGEQDSSTYRRWLEAGARRYLLRIETSNRELYARLHPADHDYDERLRCLRELKDIGYQVGTGVMIGLPFQTTEDLARDILFFRDIDVDMIGMGPYLYHHDTPLGREATPSIDAGGGLLDMSLMMIALSRIILKDVNIASTTALQALHSQGRELGLRAGANVVMPNLTPVRYRRDYLLYDSKPCVDEDAGKSRDCLARRIGAIGEKIGWNVAGDPLHALRRMNGLTPLRN